MVWDHRQASICMTLLCEHKQNNGIMKSGRGQRANQGSLKLFKNNCIDRIRKLAIDLEGVAVVQSHGGLYTTEGGKKTRNS